MQSLLAFAFQVCSCLQLDLVSSCLLLLHSWCIYCSLSASSSNALVYAFPLHPILKISPVISLSFANFHLLFISVFWSGWVIFADSISSSLYIISESLATWLQPFVFILTWAETPSPASSSWMQASLIVILLIFLFLTFALILYPYSVFFFLAFSLLFYCFLISGSLSLSSVFSFLTKLLQVHESLLQTLCKLSLLLCCLECFLVVSFSLCAALGKVCGNTNIFHTEPDSLFPVLVSALRHCCLQHKEGSSEGHAGEFWLSLWVDGVPHSPEGSLLTFWLSLSYTRV